MTTILAAIFLLLVFGLGWLMATLAGIKNGVEKTGLAFLLGSWLMTLEMMICYQVLGFFSPVMTTIVTIVSISVLCLITFLSPAKTQLRLELEKAKKICLQPRKYFRSAVSVLRSFSSLEVIILLGVCSILAYSALSNLTWPVSDWDAVALYDFRAQLIRLVGNWQEGKALGYFYHYPPYTSLLHGALYQFGFEKVKIVYTLLFSSFLMVFYSFLRQKVSRTQALLGMLLLVTAPLVWGHIVIAYTNLPYTIFFSLATLNAWKWLEQKQTSNLVMSFLLLAGSIWIRQSEPFWAIIIVILLIGVIQAKTALARKVMAACSVAFVVLLKYWPYYLQWLDLPPPPISVNDALGYSVPFSLATVVHHGFLVIDHVLDNVIRPIFFVLIPTLVVLIFDKKLLRSTHVKIVYFTLLFMMGLVFMGTYYFSFTYKSWHLIGESLTRLVMVMVPLFIYVITLSSFWALILETKFKTRGKL